jgi:hypothetical protein
MEGIKGKDGMARNGSERKPEKGKGKKKWKGYGRKLQNE